MGGGQGAAGGGGEEVELEFFFLDIFRWMGNNSRVLVFCVFYRCGEGVLSSLVMQDWGEEARRTKSDSLMALYIRYTYEFIFPELNENRAGLFVNLKA